ncbi:MAG: hypothetical protein IPQ18_14460 [Saprospiraceae bacterium]|nr:hypothetical protein [Saprospiraceae bacterium]
MDYVIHESDLIIQETRNKLIETKALQNKGRALAQLNDYVKSSEIFMKTLDNYLILGRKKELIQSLSYMIVELPLNVEWNENSLTYWIMHYSGLSYSYYYLGLAHYSVGVYESRNGKKELAVKKLIEAAGFALKSGDSITLLKSLEELSELIGLMGNNVPEINFDRNELSRTINYFKNYLGIKNSSDQKCETVVMSECKKAARRVINYYVKGEIILYTIIQIIFIFLSWLITKELKTLILCSISGGLAWILGKLWLIIKSRIFIPIERT